MSFLLHVIMQNLRFKSCFFRRLRQVSRFMFNMEQSFLCFRGRPVRQHNFIFYCIFTIFPPSTPCKTSFWINYFFHSSNGQHKCYQILTTEMFKCRQNHKVQRQTHNKEFISVRNCFINNLNVCCLIHVTDRCPKADVRWWA